MRRFFEEAARILATILGLGMFAFCLYQLAFVTRVVGSREPAIGVEERKVDELLPDPGPVVERDQRPVILVDAGHGGKDGGAVGGGVIEKNLALEISRRVVEILESDGRYRVEMTRDTDRFVELADRAKMANELGVALFVSIHLNTGPASSAEGVETWFAWPKPVGVMLAEKSKFNLPSDQRFVDERGELLAQSVQAAVCAATGARDRGVKNKGHLVTKMVGAPSILVECGFLTNPAEAKRLVDASYQKRIANGVVKGIFGYLEAAEEDPMFGIVVPVRPEKERILSQSASPGS